MTTNEKGVLQKLCAVSTELIFGMYELFMELWCILLISLKCIQIRIYKWRGSGVKLWKEQCIAVATKLSRAAAWNVVVLLEWRPFLLRCGSIFAELLEDIFLWFIRWKWRGLKRYCFDFYSSMISHGVRNVSTWFQSRRDVVLISEQWNKLGTM